MVGEGGVGWGGVQKTCNTYGRNKKYLRNFSREKRMENCIWEACARIILKCPLKAFSRMRGCKLNASFKVFNLQCFFKGEQLIQMNIIQLLLKPAPN
jgi:hypothetical protein